MLKRKAFAYYPVINYSPDSNRIESSCFNNCFIQATKS